MNIALDGTPLTEPTGGVARYTWELARALAEMFPQDNYWLLSDQNIAMPNSAPENLKAGAAPRSAIDRRWWLWGLNRALDEHQIDVFHGTDYAVPYLRRRPAVMTVHDLSPWMNADWGASPRVRHRTPRLLRANLADIVITPTEAVRKATMERFHLAADRAVTIPLAARADFRPQQNEPAAVPYFLFVGTLEPRKNLPALIDAWRKVRKQHAVDLVIAGRPRHDFTMPAPEPGLRMLGAVPDEALPALYSGALATVYPSLYEGFGLPVLEAMQCGSMVITSRDPAIMEVTGGTAIHVPADDVAQLANAMIAVAIRSPEFHNLRDNALRRAAQFTWQETARRTHEVYVAARARA